MSESEAVELRRVQSAAAAAAAGGWTASGQPGSEVTGAPLAVPLQGIRVLDKQRSPEVTWGQVRKAVWLFDSNTRFVLVLVSIRRLTFFFTKAQSRAPVAPCLILLLEAESLFTATSVTPSET